MGGFLKEARLTTPNARASLTQGVHWRSIDPDIHLGYRKGVRGGRWLVRWYQGEQKYRQVRLGTADDVISEGTLSYDAAVKLARTTVTDARRATAEPGEESIPTVGEAVRAYLTNRDARASTLAGRTIKSDATSNLGLHVLKSARIARTVLSDLAESDLRKWRRELPKWLKSSTRQRTANNFKAALNAAYREYRRRLPKDFAEMVKHGLREAGDEVSIEPRARDNQILDDCTIRRIVGAAKGYDDDGDIWRLILVLAATGARFSQIRRMCVRDVQESEKRLLVPTSRKGRGRSDGYVPVPVGRDVISALHEVCAGRELTDPLLCRWRYIQKSPTHWERDRRGAWTSASEMVRPWRTICEKAEVRGVIPYALRHSSIVRGIRAGLPIRLVAALHDTSVAMIERHYARWIADGLDELAARAVIELDNCENLG